MAQFSLTQMHVTCVPLNQHTQPRPADTYISQHVCPTQVAEFCPPDAVSCTRMSMTHLLQSVSAGRMALKWNAVDVDPHTHVYLTHTPQHRLPDSMIVWRFRWTRKQCQEDT